jgi:membrane associated rhomboid family serine protease
MIPLRDNIPHRRLPIITVMLILINIFVFIYELFLGDDLRNFIYLYGFVPQKLFLPISLKDKFFPLFSSMFLHGSWAHLLGNILFMWIFADNVEDRLGHFNFLIFYLSCGIIASLIHAFFNLGSKVPVVGASGAIAGVLGAYFTMFPYARVLTLVPFFIFWEVVELPAFFFLGIWFVYQFLLGLFSIGSMGAGIAFWAHVGGFVGGIFLLKFFLRKIYY